jgi:AraC family transcriptional regulator
MDKRILILRKYISENFQKEFSIEQLAEKVKLSASHLPALFKRETGLPPIRYIINLRLEESRKLLDGDDFTPVKQIAMQVGFNDQGHFIREFKKKYGITPKEYRKQKWEKEAESELLP